MLDAFENEAKFFTHLAVENERSPVELVARLTCTSLQILATSPIKSRSCTFKDFASRVTHASSRIVGSLKRSFIADVKQSNASKYSLRQ